MGRVADLILLNILCILCCIPIVTAGASITALYYVTLKMARDEESYIIRSFFRSFKQNFKQATIINVILLLTGAVLFIDLRIAKCGSGMLYKGLFTLFIAFAIIYALILLYIYPILPSFSTPSKYFCERISDVDSSPSADGPDACDLSITDFASVAFRLCELRTGDIYPDHAFCADGILNTGLLEIEDLC